MAEPLHKLGAFWAGADKCHVSTKDIPELRNLVEASLAHESAERRNAWVVLGSPHRSVSFGVLPHCSELTENKSASPQSDAGLAKKDGPWRRKAHGQDDQRDERQADGETDGRDRMEIKRRTTCCDAFTLKPFVKMRVLGLRPSSGSFAGDPLHEEAGIFDYNAPQAKIKEFTNRHRSATIFHGNDDPVNAGSWNCAKARRSAAKRSH